ncbi:hypothetical protein B0H19DRAFT_1202703 [Mycena capillaripes]|nr:hypothetical protein B0H19DRAFT_1202703 [Mycena capillaripes]
MIFSAPTALIFSFSLYGMACGAPIPVAKRTMGNVTIQACAGTSGTGGCSTLIFVDGALNAASQDSASSAQSIVVDNILGKWNDDILWPALGTLSGAAA